MHNLTKFHPLVTSDGAAAARLTCNGEREIDAGCSCIDFDAVAVLEFRVYDPTGIDLNLVAVQHLVPHDWVVEHVEVFAQHQTWQRHLVSWQCRKASSRRHDL